MLEEQISIEPKEIPTISKVAQLNEDLSLEIPCEYDGTFETKRIMFGKEVITKRHLTSCNQKASFIIYCSKGDGANQTLCKKHYFELIQENAEWCFDSGVHEELCGHTDRITNLPVKTI